MTSAAASTWGAVSTTHTKPWGTNPKKQPKPQPWYHTVWTDEFANAQDPNLFACQSPADVNDTLLPDDSKNGPLQKPTLKSNVSIVKAGHDKKALQVATQSGTYQTSNGPATGITNGRLNIGPEFSLANHVISIRLRSVGGPGPGQVGKSSTMIWPTADWPWEFDLAETIPGTTGAAVYHHVESEPGDTVRNFLQGTPSVDPWAWHTYTIEFLGGATVTGIKYLIDGKLVSFQPEVNGPSVTTLTGAWAPPSGIGHIAVGKALPAGGNAPFADRSAVPSNYFDAVQIDWVRILAHDTAAPGPGQVCTPDV
jgi:hypothetical protein